MTDVTTNTEQFLSRLRRTYSLEGTHAVIYDKFGGQGLHVGTFRGGPADHHDKHVTGYTVVDRIAWADRRIAELQKARDNMVAMFNGEEEE